MSVIALPHFVAEELIVARFDGGDLDREPSRRHDVEVARSKTTVYIDPEVLRAARVEAARTGRRDSDVFEEALRAYLGFEALERTWARSDLSEDQALDLAYTEVHESRRR